MFLEACVCPQGGEYLTRYTPPGPGTPPPEQRPTPTPRPGTPPPSRHPRTRYTPPRTRYTTHPRDQVHPPEQTPPSPPTRYPPSEIRPLLRTVRILLECFLVYFTFYPCVCNRLDTVLHFQESFKRLNSRDCTRNMFFGDCTTVKLFSWRRDVVCYIVFTTFFSTLAGCRGTRVKYAQY